MQTSTCKWQRAWTAGRRIQSKYQNLAPARSSICRRYENYYSKGVQSHMFGNGNPQVVSENKKIRSNIIKEDLRPF